MKVKSMDTRCDEFREAILERGGMAISELSELFKISGTQVRRVLAAMQERGLCELIRIEHRCPLGYKWIAKCFDGGSLDMSFDEIVQSAGFEPDAPNGETFDNIINRFMKGGQS